MTFSEFMIRQKIYNEYGRLKKNGGKIGNVEINESMIERLLSNVNLNDHNMPYELFNKENTLEHLIELFKEKMRKEYWDLQIINMYDNIIMFTSSF